MREESRNREGRHICRKRDSAPCPVQAYAAEGIPEPALPFLSICLCQSALKEKLLFDSSSSGLSLVPQGCCRRLQTVQSILPTCCWDATAGGSSTAPDNVSKLSYSNLGVMVKGKKFK